MAAAGASDVIILALLVFLFEYFVRFGLFSFLTGKHSCRHLGRRRRGVKTVRVRNFFSVLFLFLFGCCCLEVRQYKCAEGMIRNRVSFTWRLARSKVV